MHFKLQKTKYGEDSLLCRCLDSTFLIEMKSANKNKVTATTKMKNTVNFGY